MSKIHFETAKNSELIFLNDGRHLCSSVHPTREAKQWIGQHELKWRGCRSVLVLGLGCGYHVRALKMACPVGTRILALEPSLEIIQAALRIHPLDLSEVELIHLTSLENMKSASTIKASTLQSYAVLVHEPSAFSNAELYQEAKDFLLGRKEDGLRWLFGNRGVQLPEIIEAREINLKTVGGLSSSPVMQALRELIV